jgi:hypothetical protein
MNPREPGPRQTLLSGWNLEACAQQRTARALLESCYVRGPWTDRVGPGVLRWIERDGLTIITAGDSPAIQATPRAPSPHRCMTAALKLPDVAGSSPPPLLFPLRPAARISLPDISRQAQCVLREFPTREPLGVILNGTTHPALVLAFELSDFIARMPDEWGFLGLGHVRLLLKDFLERSAQVRFVRVWPWPSQRPPLALSFDVESLVGQRSAGRRIAGFGLGQRDLVRLDRLMVFRPRVGKRLIGSINELDCIDRAHRSFRLLIDRRRDQMGCFADEPAVPQYQLQFLVRPKAKRTDGDYTAFAAWLSREHIRATNFVCGVDRASMAHCEDVAFHSFDHRHFHSLSRDELAKTLDRAADTFFDRPDSRLIRAPGLLWSKDYFELLGKSTFTADSSFREWNSHQPLCPIRVANRWWELPVHAHVTQAAQDPRIIAIAAATEIPLNLYAHDHDVLSADGTAAFRAQMTTLLNRWPTEVVPLAQVVDLFERTATDSVRHVPAMAEDEHEEEFLGRVDVAICPSSRIEIRGAAQ